MDVISVGEMLIDFTPGKEANSYVRNPGGAPANAVIAIARNGLSTGFAGKLGDDDFGRFLKETLEKEGVKVLCPELTKEAMALTALRPGTLNTGRIRGSIRLPMKSMMP